MDFLGTTLRSTASGIEFPSDIVCRDMILSRLLAAPFDVLNGVANDFISTTIIDSGSSSGVSTSTPGFVYPSQTSQSSSASTASSAYSNITFITREFALTNNKVLTEIAIDATAAQTVTVKVVRRNSAGNYDVIRSEGLSHTGTGYESKVLSSPYTVPSSGTFYVGAHFGGANRYRGSIAQASASGNVAVGTGITFTESSSAAICAKAIYAPDSIDLRTTGRAIESVPRIVDIFALIQEDESLTPGTDLTIYATRNGGTTWTSGTAVRVASIGDFELWRAVSIDVSAQSSASSLGLRFVSSAGKKFGIKSVAAYGRV